MRILVIGAGAIGGSTAAFMTKAGEDVTVLCRSEKTANELKNPGMKISGVRGEHVIPLNTVLGHENLEGEFELCIVSTKAYDTIDAVKSALPYLSAEGIVLVLQNGICVDELLEEAIDMVITDGQASISMLQRRLKVGYARAGRLIDDMAARGIVSKSLGSKPREVLITREEYDRIKSTLLG